MWVKSVTLKVEQPTLVVSRSRTLCVQQPTVSCTEVVVHCRSDSWRAEQFWLCQIPLQVENWYKTLTKTLDLLPKVGDSPTLPLFVESGTGLPCPEGKETPWTHLSPLMLFKSTREWNDKLQSMQHKELLNRAMTEVFPYTYFLCTWLSVAAGQTDTISLLGLDSRWECKSTVWAVWDVWSSNAGILTITTRHIVLEDLFDQNGVFSKPVETRQSWMMHILKVNQGCPGQKLLLSFIWLFICGIINHYLTMSGFTSGHGKAISLLMYCSDSNKWKCSQ